MRNNGRHALRATHGNKPCRATVTGRALPGRHRVTSRAWHCGHVMVMYFR